MCKNIGIFSCYEICCIITKHNIITSTKIQLLGNVCIEYFWLKEIVHKNIMDDFLLPKLIYPETTQGAFFAYDETGLFLDKTCFMMISKHARYLQATLSSQLFEFAYKRIFSSIELGQHGFQYNKHALIKLPVKKLNKSDSIIYSDEFFYNCYGITNEEIEYIINTIQSPQNQ